jgi:hypothetical protein
MHNARLYEDSLASWVGSLGVHMHNARLALQSHIGVIDTHLKIITSECKNWDVEPGCQQLTACVCRSDVRANKQKTNELHGLSPRANYTDRATAASRRSVANLCG